ncbi:MAG: GGDEF domain-containing protein [Anaerotignaceae bacterium]
MKDYEELYEKWRNVLFYTNLGMSAFVFIVEVLMYFVLARGNLILQPLPEYLTKFLILPTIINCVVICVGYIALKRACPKMKFINYIPVIQMSVICMVIACTHSFFSVTQCIFCIPIFTTLIFNDKTMTKRVAVINFLFLIFVFISRKYSATNATMIAYLFPEALVSFSFTISVYIVCNILINYQEEKDMLIVKGYVHKIRMQEMLNKDQKTGLYGHTALLNTLKRKTSVEDGCAEEFALVIIDVDDFKKVNDTYGHAMGDQIIIALAELMKKHCGDKHLPARFGGEEFAIILNEQEKNYCFNFVEKLRKDFALITNDIINETVTISCGIATWTPSLTSEKLFNNADSAMHQSKTTGKNKTTNFE